MSITCIKRALAKSIISHLQLTPAPYTCISQHLHLHLALALIFIY
jgi:hypothetical protein